MLRISNIIGNVNRDDSLRAALEAYDSEGQVERVVLDDHDRKRSRLRTTTDDGTDLGLVINNESGLSAGDVLAHSDDRIIVVASERTEAAIVDLTFVETKQAALELGHHLGNQHWNLTVQDNQLYVPVPDKRTHVERSIKAVLGDVPVDYDYVDPALFGTDSAPHGHTHETGSSEGVHLHHNHNGTETDGHDD